MATTTTLDRRDVKRQALAFLLEGHACSECGQDDPRYLRFVQRKGKSAHELATENRYWPDIVDVVRQSTVLCTYHRDQRLRGST